MASTNGSEPVDPGKDVARQRGAQGVSTSQDPQVLAEEIERTREDLAETLDLIADRVSPKRVADRTKKRVAAAAEMVKARVVEQAGVAREKAVAQVGAAKEAAAGARDKVVEQAGAARERVAPTSALAGGSVRLEASSSPAYARPDDGSALPPTAGVPVSGLDLSTAAPVPAARHASPASGSGTALKKEYVVGGVLGALVLLLLRRRRSRRRRVSAVPTRKRR